MGLRSQVDRGRRRTGATPNATPLRAPLILLVFTAVALFVSLAIRGAATDSVLASPQVLRIPGEAGAIAIDATRGRAYVTDIKANALVSFDLRTSAPLATVSVGRQPGQVVLSGDRAFVSNFDDRTISVVDTARGARVATIDAGGLGLALDATAGRLYAAAGSHISVVDVASFSPTAKIAAPDGAVLWGLTLDAASGRLYATDSVNARVFVYDTSSRELVRTLRTDAPVRFGIALGAPGELLVAGYTADAHLSVIDVASGLVIASRAVAPFTNALTRQSSSGLVFTASADARSVSAVDTRIAQSAPTAKAAFDARVGAVAINPLTDAPLAVLGSAGGVPTAPSPRNAGPLDQP